MDTSTETELLRRMDAYWRAANYLSVGQIYLLDNPLLTEPLKLEHVKPRLLGHWGTTPGQNFVYVHLNRIIKQYDLNMIYISGPGHGGPALVANTYLEGTYSEFYPNITRDERGIEETVQAVLVPGRHSQPRGARDPGLDPRRGRAGLQPQPCLRRGVRQPRPDRRLRRRRRRGRDRPAGHELALQQVPQPGPRRRRAADPPPERLQDRQPDGPGPHRPRGARASVCAATATSPYFVEGHEPEPMHRLMAATLDTVVAEIRRIQADARNKGVDRAAALADDRPQDAQRLDRPQGWSTACRSKGRIAPTRSRSRSRPSNPEHLKHARELAAELQARGTLRRGRPAPSPSSPISRRKASVGWGPTRTPTAASCSETCGCPTSATMRSRSHSPAM